MAGGLQGPHERTGGVLRTGSISIRTGGVGIRADDIHTGGRSLVKWQASDSDGFE